MDLVGGDVEDESSGESHAHTNADDLGPFVYDMLLKSWTRSTTGVVAYFICSNIMALLCRLKT